MKKKIAAAALVACIILFGCLSWQNAGRLSWMEEEERFRTERDYTDFKTRFHEAVQYYGEKKTEQAWICYGAAEYYAARLARAEQRLFGSRMGLEKILTTLRWEISPEGWEQYSEHVFQKLSFLDEWLAEPEQDNPFEADYFDFQEKAAEALTQEEGR